LSLVGLVHGLQQVRSLFACFGLATGETSVSVGQFLAIGVTPVSLRPLITVGNLDAWSYLDIV
jgi:hypothetical protein